MSKRNRKTPQSAHDNSRRYAQTAYLSHEIISEGPVGEDGYWWQLQRIKDGKREHAFWAHVLVKGSRLVIVGDGPDIIFSYLSGSPAAKVGLVGTSGCDYLVSKVSSGKKTAFDKSAVIEHAKMVIKDKVESGDRSGIARWGLLLRDLQDGEISVSSTDEWADLLHHYLTENLEYDCHWRRIGERQDAEEYEKDCDYWEICDVGEEPSSDIHYAKALCHRLWELLSRRQREHPQNLCAHTYERCTVSK